MNDAVRRCLSFVRERDRPHLVVPINVAILTKMHQDSGLREAVQAGDLVLADGMPIVWLSWIRGCKLPCRVTGVDLMAALQKAADRECLRIFYLGARPEVVQTLVERVRRDFPNLIVAGYRDGYFGPDQESQVIRQIGESRADILLVAMSSPHKEIWSHRNLSSLAVPVVLPVGGAFDVHAGFLPRAPIWMQASGLEWLWRLMMEPRRMWHRYLVTNAQFLTLILHGMLNLVLHKVGRASRKERRPASDASKRAGIWSLERKVGVRPKPRF
jgi:N-acetylglucosaminyldiphosphoundecaprenol N-acetyl-beta-D-mannosaminyltransferase